MKRMRAILLLLLCYLTAGIGAERQTSKPNPPATANPRPVEVPPDYVIGPGDVLAILFWRDKELSYEVVVRPDGKISMPLLNDVHAAGLTPEQLRMKIDEEARKYISDPTAAVIVKGINSRKVYVAGQIGRPGEYPLLGPTTVLQLIALAGGPVEFSKSDKIMIVRMESGREVIYPFNYKEVIKGKRLRQNIQLKPGDTIIVP